MNPIHHNVLFGSSKSFWVSRYARRKFRVTLYRDYQQPWHVIAPRNYTLRVRVPGQQYFFWVKRGS